MLKNFKVSTEIIMGLESIEKIVAKAKEFNASKVFVVTDKGIKEAGILDRLIDIVKLAKLEVEVYDQVEANPSIDCINKGFEVFRKDPAQLLVAIGGGSCIDAAKGIGILVTNPGDLSQYSGVNKLRNPTLPLIAIPTTAGTGSEVTATALITDKKNKYKSAIVSPYNVPDVAILDATLLTNLPRKVAAETGLDALTHGIEAYTSIIATPITDAIAIKAIELISENIRCFVARRDNLEIGEKMLVASNMGGIALANARLGTVHAMAAPLGGHYNLPHGLVCAMLLPYVMKFSLEGNLQKYADIARAMGEDIGGLSLRSAAEKAVEALMNLNEDLGIPQKLSKLGVEKEKIDELTRDAMKGGLQNYNAAETSYKDISDLFEQAI